MSSAEMLLGVWAHPDDEVYLSAALMALTRRAGGRVVVATATLGEQGVVEGVRSPLEVAALRAAEQRQALHELGVSESRWLGYADGTLADQDAEQAIGAISSLIEEVGPTLLVTFGPEGMTGHSDHRTVSTWVTAAWNRTGRRAPLWYATVTDRWHQRWNEVNQSVGLWFEGSTPPRAGASRLSSARKPTRPGGQRRASSLRVEACVRHARPQATRVGPGLPVAAASEVAPG